MHWFTYTEDPAGVPGRYGDGVLARITRSQTFTKEHRGQEPNGRPVRPDPEASRWALRPRPPRPRDPARLLHRSLEPQRVTSEVMDGLRDDRQARSITMIVCNQNCGLSPLHESVASGLADISRLLAVLEQGFPARSFHLLTHGQCRDSASRRLGREAPVVTPQGWEAAARRITCCPNQIGLRNVLLRGR
jgi:hypothetical protein